MDFKAEMAKRVSYIEDTIKKYLPEEYKVMVNNYEEFNSKALGPYQGVVLKFKNK